MARNNIQHPVATQQAASGTKVKDYSNSHYVLKKAEKAIETLTKFPPPAK
jgi:hypothetical protein